MRRVALIAVVILASCGGNGETTRSTQPPPTLTSLPPATASASATTTTTNPATTTTTTTTTTTLPDDAAAEFAFSQVVFGDLAFVIIINWGNDAGRLTGLWLSQGTSVQALPDVEVGPGEQVLLGLASEQPPDLTGMAAVLHVGPSVGDIVKSGGELALHNSDDFDDPGSLIDYVAWGVGPQLRLEQAAEAGIWDGSKVEVVDEAPSISTGIYPAVRAEDWATDLGG
jgi:hypothetical protein